jgi:hypothetical protein
VTTSAASAPAAFGVAHQADAFAVLFDPAPGDDRHAARGLLHHDLDHGFVFVVAERRALAGGADGDDPVAALAMCQSTSTFRVSRSSSPSLNGVTSAGMDPRSMAGL